MALCDMFGLISSRWDELSPENLLEQSKETIFFKTVELAYTEGNEYSNSSHTHILNVTLDVATT